MLDTLWAARDTLTALRNFAAVRIVAALANGILNLLAVRDLVDATVHTSPADILVAVAWLIPWYRLLAPALRRLPGRPAAVVGA